VNRLLAGQLGRREIGRRPRRLRAEPVVATRGATVQATTVEVSTSGTPLGQFQLDEDRQEAVTVQLPPGPREKVSFAFSDHMVDAAGRRISLFPQETNMFREEDLAAVL
jgi:hypothetical protein